MSEPTPGPWTICTDSSGYLSISPIDAFIVSGSAEITDTDRANAALVAAAPDLLRELGGIADALTADETITIEPGSVKAESIRAAVAKAKPPQPGDDIAEAIEQEGDLR